MTDIFILDDAVLLNVTIIRQPAFRLSYDKDRNRSCSKMSRAELVKYDTLTQHIILYLIKYSNQDIERKEEVYKQ